MKYDIVYILKNNIDSDEIRYSLRSVCKNFPYERIWFVGGCPDGIVPDRCVKFQQIGYTKWQLATSSIYKACQTDDITDDFWLFNDDFFVMKPVDGLDPMIRGTLQERVRDIEVMRNDIPSAYSQQLRKTIRVLKLNGYPQNDYALHVPMLINKQKGIEVINMFQNCAMFRSLYGNYCGIDAIKVRDVKVRNKTSCPTDLTLLSTDDESFYYGKVGEYIRECFPEPCKYEV